MKDSSNDQPFQPLGNELKGLRQKKQESLAEVSGAVEIDEEVLVRIEQGDERPSEDILMLLINHFNIHEDEAIKLWEMAGYERHHEQDEDSPEDVLRQTMKSQPVVMVMALDQRVVYSDSAEIHANKNGVVLSFSQTNGNQTMTVSKIGMSYEHAKSVLEILQRTIEEAARHQQPKQLPGSLEGGDKNAQS